MAKIKKKYQPIPDEQAYKNLDGALINPDTIDKSKLPNQNYYFIGAAFGALGLFLGIFGVIRYTVSNEEFFILLALGLLFAIPGFAFTIKAAVYLLSWNSFLQSAYLTKCNVFQYVKIQEVTDTPYRGEVSRYYFAFYKLKVCYIDASAQKQIKTVKYLTARNLSTKMSSYIIPEGDKYSLYGECIVAYNKSGKIRLIF